MGLIYEMRQRPYRTMADLERLLIGIRCSGPRRLRSAIAACAGPKWQRPRSPPYPACNQTPRVRGASVRPSCQCPGIRMVCRNAGTPRSLRLSLSMTSRTAAAPVPPSPGRLRRKEETPAFRLFPNRHGWKKIALLALIVPSLLADLILIGNLKSNCQIPIRLTAVQALVTLPYLSQRREKIP